MIKRSEKADRSGSPLTTGKVLIAALLLCAGIALIGGYAEVFENVFDTDRQTLPQGYYTVGKDIPAGVWEITGEPEDHSYALVTVYDNADCGDIDILEFLSTGENLEVKLQEGNVLNVDKPFTIDPMEESAE